MISVKRSFLILGILLIMVACGNGPKKPKNLISKEEMVSILIDAKLISSANSVNRKVMQENGIFPDSYVFNKYDIDSIQFAESNAYYTYRVKDYEEIYEIVKDSLERLKAQYEEQQDKEIKEAEKRRKDSLNAVLKKNDSLKLLKSKDSLVVEKLNDSLLTDELEDLGIDDEIELIEPVSDK